MKKIFINKTGWALILLLCATFTSCLKDKGYDEGEYGAVRGTEGGKYVSLRTAGLSNFSKSSLIINSTKTDTIRYDIFIDVDYETATNSPITFTLGVDNSKIAPYNASAGTNFQAASPTMFKILTPTVTIPASERSAKVTVEVYQNKFDPATSYIIPITILSADGASLSSNLSTKYVNIIGNPLAGSYTYFYRRFQSADTSGTPLAFTPKTVTVAPVTATTVLLPQDYLQTFVPPSGGINLSFTNPGGVFSNLSVAFDAAALKELAPAGFTVASPPVLIAFSIMGTAANGYAGTTFRVYYSVVNSTGGTRSFVDSYVKQ